MSAQGSGGRIINISSVHEDWPNAGHSSYCIQKGGCEMLTRNGSVLELAKGQRFLLSGVGPTILHPTHLGAVCTITPDLNDRLEGSSRVRSLTYNQLHNRHPRPAN